MSAAQPVVGSSSTIWATPSKEWVIPAKPKPGRKPKKDATPLSLGDAETDAKGRRVQNRAAQRAFRERKQSQLADLQARVQQYEQGEIERNVALQNVAKRLKDENDKLRSENALLKERFDQVEEERDSLREASKKRWRDESLTRQLSSAPDTSSRKKARVEVQHTMSYSQLPPVSASYLSSPSSASSPGSHTSFSPIPILPPPREPPILTQGGGNVLGNIFDFISSGKSNIFEPGGSLDTFDCGFCDESSPCVCRELAIQQVSERLSETDVTPKEETSEYNSPVFSMTSPVRHPSPPISILDNLPAYQPPVPLRRRNVNVLPNSIFPVTASCSGDPSNCLACADDPFGKAFCAAITKSVASAVPCGNCPCSESPGGRSPNVKCCGNRGQCGGSPGAGSSPRPAASATSGLIHTTSMGAASTHSTSSETIPCNDAWRQIKSHPNVAFADLELLAEVVARRSKCTGPRVEISPAPGTVTPERGLSPRLLSSQLSGQAGSDDQPVLLTDPHARYRESRGGSAVSREGSTGTVDIVVSCGRSRVREVQADGVRDALRLLDKFPSS